jgi:integrating conjugative element protein (TIGR03761 family)
MADELRLNLGALRSAMQLTLHTHHASRIWHGRTKTEQRHGIIGLNGFVSIMNKMKRGAEQDDPYSDWWMIKVEEKLGDTKARLQVLREQVDQVLASIPPALTLGENCNVQPVKLPLYVGSQHGFLAVYLLAEYDDLARRLILAHHTALIDRDTMAHWLDEGAHLLRSTFALAQRYRYSGAARDDFAANNAVARAARERFGELSQDVLEGTRRARFAPPIVRRSKLASLDAVGAGAADATLAQPSAENDSLLSDIAIEDDATAEIADEDTPA